MGDRGGVRMKVKIIARSHEQCTRERAKDAYALPRNADPLLHPFAQAREVQRALNATKLDRLFAKPFVGCLEGHRDGVYCLARDPSDIRRFASGGADGEVRVWNLQTRKCERVLSTCSDVRSGSSFCRALAFTPQDSKLLTAGDEGVVRLWSEGEVCSSFKPEHGGAINGIDTHRQGSLFATADARGKTLIWDLQRAQPSMDLGWGAETVCTVRFNQADVNVLASTATDRSVILHDLRTKSSIAKVYLPLRANALCWNPQEAYYFAVASEDYNAYSFDMRFLDKATNIWRGHVNAVMDIDYSPTGQEVLTASYDRTVRLWPVREGHSRDVYHTSRMQRVFTAKFSADSHYCISGSDEGGVRLWRAQASKPVGPMAPRQRASLEYAEALKQRYAAIPEINRISRHRHLPKSIKIPTRTHRVQLEAEKRRDANRRKHERSTEAPKTMREQAILTVKK